MKTKQIKKMKEKTEEEKEIALINSFQCSNFLARTIRERSFQAEWYG